MSDPVSPASAVSPVSAAPPALEARDLAVPFGEAPGLSHISFRVARGERFALVGSSGVGKTSLLRALSGSGSLTSGSVLVAGKDVTDRPPEDRGMVLLSQRPLLFPHLSVSENVAFPLRVRRTGKSEMEDRVRAALEFVRMEDFGPRRPQSLSGGQAHRVALARAVVARPKVLLLDEPLTSLDPSLREEVREAILTVQEEYRPAMVLVTHDLQEAGRMAHFIGVILEGSLAQVAPPAELFRNPASPAVARALGIPNSIQGNVIGDGTLVLAGWRLNGPGVEPPAAPAPKEPGRAARPARLIFGPEAGRLTSRDSGGVSVRVEELRHHPEGATARVAILPPYTVGAQGSAGSRGDSSLAAHGALLPSSTSILVALDPLHAPELGETMDLILDPRRIHVFPE